MKKFVFTIIAILPLFTFIACENEIPYREGNVIPKLIVNSLINIDAQNNYVYLQYTGKSYLGDVNDGIVTVSVNGDRKETCERELYNNGYVNASRYSIKTRFSPGDVVRIDVHAGNNKYHAWAEEVVPQRPFLQKVDTLPTYFSDGYSWYAFKQLKYKIDIRDIPDEKNFYRILMWHEYDISGKLDMIKDTVITVTDAHFWPWEDVVLTDGKPATSEELETGFVERVMNGMGIFKDVRFENGSYTMTVSSSYQIPRTAFSSFDGIRYEYYNFTPQTMSIYTTVRLQQITESQYYYMNALNYLGSDAYEPYLYDAIAIPGNVNGGTGIVGFCSETTSERFTIAKDYKFNFDL